MIRLTDVTANEGKIQIAAVTLGMSAGTTAVLGAPNDGTSLLLALMAGAAKVSRGVVRVVEDDPRSAQTRRAIGYVPLVVDLPEALHVTDALTLMSAIRGAAIDVKTALARFGLDGLAQVRVSRLSRAQARSVALAEAVASSVVRVLLIDEPFVSMEPSAAAALASALKSATNRCVVIATSSPVDARDLAASHVVLTSGRVTRLGTSNDLIQSGGVARLVALAEDPRALLGALASEPDLLSIESKGRAVVVTARDLETAARAIGRGVITSGTSLDSLDVEHQGP